jgi:hypothetical protein
VSAVTDPIVTKWVFLQEKSEKCLYIVTSVYLLIILNKDETNSRVMFKFKANQVRGSMQYLAKHPTSQPCTQHSIISRTG